MSSPSPGSATSEDATAASGEGMKGLVKLCRLFGRNNSRSRTILVSSRALMVAAAAMSLSQILVYDWQPSYTCATVDVTHVFIRYRQVLVEALQGDIMMFDVCCTRTTRHASLPEQLPLLNGCLHDRRNHILVRFIGNTCIRRSLPTTQPTSECTLILYLTLSLSAASIFSMWRPLCRTLLLLQE